MIRLSRGRLPRRGMSPVAGLWGSRCQACSPTVPHMFDRGSRIPIDRGRVEARIPIPGGGAFRYRGWPAPEPAPSHIRYPGVGFMECRATPATVRVCVPALFRYRKAGGTAAVLSCIPVVVSAPTPYVRAAPVYRWGVVLYGGWSARPLPMPLLAPFRCR